VAVEKLQSVLVVLLVAWGAITSALIIFVIYRGTLGNREEDQIFLNGATDLIAREQRELVARIERLNRPITALVVLSGSLLAVIAGLWLWQVFKTF
jgi:hypothetical protein